MKNKILDWLGAIISKAKELGLSLKEVEVSETDFSEIASLLGADDPVFQGIRIRAQNAPGTAFDEKEGQSMGYPWNRLQKHPGAKGEGYQTPSETSEFWISRRMTKVI